MKLFFVGFIFLLLLGIFCFWKVRKDYQTSKLLSPMAVIGGWCFYTFHLFLTLYAAWIRNPQIVGWFFLLLGISLISKSGLATVMAVLFLVLFQIYAPVEEEYLEEIFGDEYRQYKVIASRYLGWPKRP